MIEAFGSIRRERPSRGDAGRLCEEAAQPGPLQSCIGEARHKAAQASQQIDRTQQTLAQRQSVASNTGMEQLCFEQLCFEQRKVDIRGTFGGAGFAGEAAA